MLVFRLSDPMTPTEWAMTQEASQQLQEQVPGGKHETHAFEPFAGSWSEEQRSSIFHGKMLNHQNPNFS